MKIIFICECNKPGEVNMYTTGTRSLEVSNKKQRSRRHELEDGDWTLGTIIKFHSTANEFSSCCDHRPQDTRVSNIIVDRGRRGHLCFVFT